MKLIASFFVLLLVSSMSIVSAASIISIEIDSNTLEAGEIAEINGSVESGIAGKPIGIEIKDSDGTIILIRTITSDSNGNFTLKFKVPSSSSGNLDIIGSVEIDGQSFSESVSVSVSKASAAVEAEAVDDAVDEAEKAAAEAKAAEAKAAEAKAAEAKAAEAKAAEAKAAEAKAAEAKAAEAKAAAEARVNAGCGDGTVLVNGVCEAPKTSGMSIEPLYIVIAVVAIGGGAGAIFILKQISKTPRSVQQKPKKEIQNKGTAPFCGRCGMQYRTDAKFCGKCGAPRS